MNDKLYNVRVSFHNGNPITLELKACGNLYIIPGREYYFENAPINFINYLAQLSRCGISYQITPNKRGCYYTMDLTGYNNGDPRYTISRLRKLENPTEEKKKPEVNNNEKGIVLSSDDFAPRDNKVQESKAEAELNQMIADDLKEATESTPDVEMSAEVVVEEKEETTEVKEEETTEQKVYTEAELNRAGKPKLLEISAALGLDYSDIDTKKTIRDAILEAQKK